MADTATIGDWLQGLTYKPGWEVRDAGRADGHHYITVRATEPDTNNPAGQFSTSPLFRIPEGVTQEQFYDWILDVCIPGIETHERWEWLRINGQKWRDPHAPGMPAFATDF